MSSDRRPPIWLLPNLLSLDAPLVALAWLWVFANVWRADYHPVAAYIGLALVVWTIYIFDRLLDAVLRTGSPELMEDRHRFHLKHRKWFFILGTATSIGAVFVTLAYLPVHIFHYALFSAALVVGFFILGVFTTNRPQEIPYAKNILAGLGFAYGTAMAAHVYLLTMDGATGMRFVDLMLMREVLCFGVLCIVNITAIDLWEGSSRTQDTEQKATNTLALTLPLMILACVAMFCAWQAQQEVLSQADLQLRPDGRDPAIITRSFYYGVLVSSGLLLALNHQRERFSTQALRVLADVALLAGPAAFAVGNL